MKSARLTCTWREAVAVILPTLAVLAVMAVVLNVAGHAGWLPARPVAADADLTVLNHQAQATHDGPPAEIVITGDSTCLAGVDAAALSRQLPGRPPTLSLALFLWLDMSVYGDAVAAYAAAHPGQPRTVILLVSPAKLASASADPGDIWNLAQPSRRAVNETAPGTDLVAAWLGAGLLKRHVLSHCLATPLHGSGAGFFGFSSEIDRYMTEHNGSVLTFGDYSTPRGAARVRWALSPEVEKESRAFKAKLPAETRLLIGLTPGPEGTRAGGPWRRELLEGWNRWLQADVVLTNLPATLPDVFFSPGGHLNVSGQRRFTVALARELSSCLREP